MRAYLLFLAIFFCEIAYANDQNNFYESRYNFLKNYIEQLKTLQDKDKNYKGSVVETISGSFFISFGRDSQNKIDLETLNKCNLKEGVDCKVRFQSLKKNKDYNRLAKFDKKNNLLSSLENKINSKIVDEHKEIVFLKNIKTFNQKNFECKKNVTSFKQLIYLIKKEIDVYPIKFINNLKSHPSFSSFIFFDNYISNELFHDYIMQSDFILPLIHPNVPYYDLYLKYKISGSYNLAFAYKIPLLIEQSFSEVMDFQENSIFYNYKNINNIFNLINKNSKEFYQHPKWEFEYQKEKYLSFVLDSQIQL